MSNQLRFNTLRLVLILFYSSLPLATICTAFSHDAINARGTIHTNFSVANALSGRCSNQINKCNSHHGRTPFFILPIVFSAFQGLGIIFSFINADTKHHKCMPCTTVNYIQTKWKISSCAIQRLNPKWTVQRAKYHPADHSTIIFSGNLALARSSHIFARYTAK